MAIDIAFKLLKTVDARETRKWKRVPRIRNARKEIVRTEPSDIWPFQQ